MIAAARPVAPTVVLERLLEPPPSTGPVRGGRLPGPLGTRYGGDLAIPLRSDRPTVVANFVSTLDGVVSYATPEGAGGGEISGFFEPDRFVMGLLRALADVVLIGAGTLRAAPEEAWTPRAVHPASAADLADLRRDLGLAPEPITAVVTGSGAIDPAHPGLADTDVPVLIVTTERAHSRPTGALPGHVEVVVAGSDRVEPRAVLDLLAARGAGLVLCEGGPRLFGDLVQARLVDELFLTLAPQVAGRSAGRPRLGLVEGTAFAVAEAPWARLVGLRRAGDHLFARYRLEQEGTDA